MQATSSVSKRVSSGLAGFATARAHADQLAALRKNPGLPSDKTLPPGFLKNSDDQTVLALATVNRAMISLGRPTAFYQDWGIIAAPNLFARLGTLQSLLNFRKDGAWGISPHLIPHHSLHAVSGAISQALQIYGPNFGIGGGPNAAVEAFLAAATMISEYNLPGLWVVLSGHERECLPPAENGRPEPPTPCLAAALAVEPLTNAKYASYLHVSGGDDAPTRWPEFTLPDFLNSLEAKVPSGHWKLPGSGWLRLSDAIVEEPL